jgi:hypothetical protein
MMKRIFVLLLICAPLLPVGAQINLVKNPSFERLVSCPHMISLVSYANDWSAIVDTTYLLDSEWVHYDSLGSIYRYDCNCFPYFCNSCDSSSEDPSGFATVPHGIFWNHFPHSGKGMMWVIMYDYDPMDCDARMYLQGRLYHSLEVGKSYCVTYYVLNTFSSSVGCNNIAAYLDNGTIDTAHECGFVHREVPQIILDSIIIDTVNWTKIQGSFVATGNERFITIGNFSDSAHTSILPFNSAGQPNFAAYLIDDVSVIANDAVADAGPDRVTSPLGDSVWVGDTAADYLPCYWYVNGVLADSNKSGFKVHPDSTTTYVMALEVCGNVTYDTAVVYVFPAGLAEPNKLPVQQYALSPNPNNGSFKLMQASADGLPVRLEVLNTVGQSVYESQLVFVGRISKVSLVDVPPGIYLISLTDTEGRNFKFKFVVQ